ARLEHQATPLVRPGDRAVLGKGPHHPHHPAGPAGAAPPVGFRVRAACHPCLFPLMHHSNDRSMTGGTDHVSEVWRSLIATAPRRGGSPAFPIVTGSRTVDDRVGGPPRRVPRVPGTEPGAPERLPPGRNGRLGRRPGRPTRGAAGNLSRP